ncbi:MAG: Hpt domain-containing protein [Oscillospiraceae bacterium]|nr:Hpt domain-containing protein [Oscillospiraceae bacterium]
MDISQNKLFAALKEQNVDIEGTLSRFMGNDELYIKFLTRYPDENDVTPVIEAAASGDNDRLVMTAHKLKGVSINLGLNGIAEKAGAIESGAKNRTLDDPDAAAAELKAEYDTICRIIKENI